MKIKLLKSFLLALIAAMLPQLASAYDFMVGGLCYNFNDDSTSVTLTYETEDYPHYTNLNAALIIPPSVTYNGNTYSVISIDQDAFRECSGLTSVIIPNSVKTIGWGAFSSCTSLTSVFLPSSVETLGYGTNNNAFWGCKGLISIIVDEGNTKYDSRNNCNAIIETETNRLVSGCKNTIIPNTATAIGAHAFLDQTELTTIDIPNSVKSIGWGAFSGCSNLNSIIIPTSVTSIALYAFQNCTGLETVHWNAICCDDFSPSYRPFINSTGITTFVFGNEVEKIPTYLCQGLSGLTSVSIPNSVNSIGRSAFECCSGLTSITIPNSVTSINGKAFSGCNKLRSITSKIENPESVTYGSDIFQGVSTNYCKLYVPTGKVEDYQFTAPWSDFLNILEEEGGGSTTPVYGDVNGDGIVTVADVTAIYNILLWNNNGKTQNQ